MAEDKANDRGSEVVQGAPVEEDAVCLTLDGGAEAAGNEDDGAFAGADAPNTGRMQRRHEAAAAGAASSFEG